MAQDAGDEFPRGLAFLQALESANEHSLKHSDAFLQAGGKRLPDSVEKLGTLLSLLYQAACCRWGCRGGDHAVEWLAGRSVNLGISAYKLIRSAFYDEALLLVRSIGEIANLLWLFRSDERELPAWKNSTRKQRLKRFSPRAVRTRLEERGNVGAIIDRERYGRLCELATHPMPGVVPGQFSGAGRPILGMIMQPAGVFVAVNELSLSLAVTAVPASHLLDLDQGHKSMLGSAAVALLRSLGRFHVLNYHDLLRDVRLKHEGAVTPLRDGEGAHPQAT